VSGCILEGYAVVPAQSGRARLAAGTWRTWTMTAGTYRFTTLVATLQSSLIAAHADLAQFRAIIDTDGQVKLYVAAGTAIEVEWPSGLWLADVLGFVAATATAPTTGVRGTLPPSYRAQLLWEAISDPDQIVLLQTVLDADEAREVLVHAPPYRECTIDLEVSGWHGSGEVDDYLRLERFVEGAVADGALLRYYPDASVSSAWSRLTTPRGYREGYAGRTTWAPRLASQRVLGRYRQSLTVRWQ